MSFPADTGPAAVLLWLLQRELSIPDPLWWTEQVSLVAAKQHRPVTVGQKNSSKKEHWTAGLPKQLMTARTSFHTSPAKRQPSVQERDGAIYTGKLGCSAAAGWLHGHFDNQELCGKNWYVSWTRCFTLYGLYKQSSCAQTFVVWELQCGRTGRRPRLLGCCCYCCQTVLDLCPSEIVKQTKENLLGLH